VREQAACDAGEEGAGGEWRMVVYSLLLILIMLFRTEGLMGTKESKLVYIEEAD
jgi:ABC-type branched-subunit amino acid transport system permease subunit